VFESGCGGIFPDDVEGVVGLVAEGEVGEGGYLAGGGTDVANDEEEAAVGHAVELTALGVDGEGELFRFAEFEWAALGRDGGCRGLVGSGWFWGRLSWGGLAEGDGGEEEKS
jgi:hypothetical protein